ncbi:MAG: gamma-butyrobetaine dioxygenase [Gammaproteobacteria bacterium]|jgi:gamma-butyrobetaine dioxygenase
MIKSTAINDKNIEIVWADGLKKQIPGIAFRHSPGFPGISRPAGEHGRFPSIGSDLIPHEANVVEEGELVISWQPGDVESRHSVDWLDQYHPERKRSSTLTPKVNLWDAQSASEFVPLNFEDILDDEKTRLLLFEELLLHGVVLIRNLPVEIDRIYQIANWFGMTPANPYSNNASNPVVSDIRVNPAVAVATHQSHFLGPHTDTCWRQTLIGILFMHCLKSHDDGGCSMLVDGFKVAQRLKEESPESFDLLANLVLDFSAPVSEQDDWRVKGRIISLAADGVVEGIRYNGNSIGQLDLPDDLIEPAYRALEQFERILYDQSLWWQLLLKPGDLLIIDNHRVLHGRQAFNPTKAERHLQCCSVDRDHFHNRYRALARSLGSSNWDVRLTAGVI